MTNLLAAPAASAHRTDRLAPVCGLAGGLLGVLAVVLMAGLVAVRWPTGALIVVGAGLVVGVMLAHIERAVLAYVALEPFGDLVATVHPAAVKAAGALLFLAWLTRLLIDARPVRLRHPGLVAAGALGLVLIASSAAQAATQAVNLGVAMRYAPYLAVLVVLVDTLRGADRTARLRRVAAVFVLSCTAAGIVGLVGFLADGGRAAGPMEDANDFAFFLISAVPFALWLAAGRGARARTFGLCVVVLAVATLATFSRGALLGLALMLVAAVCLGLVRMRVVLVGVLSVAVAVMVVWAGASEVVDRSVTEKQRVASGNVDSRFTSWEMAAAMTADRPLLGHGPGGFGSEGWRYVPAGAADTTHLDVAHQMYLDVSSELGLLGLVAFLSVLGLGIRGALRARSHPDTRGPGSAVVVSFVGVLVAACFLSEQYYLPIWLLAAFGISLDPTPDHRKAV